MPSDTGPAECICHLQVMHQKTAVILPKLKSRTRLNAMVNVMDTRGRKDWKGKRRREAGEGYEVRVAMLMLAHPHRKKETKAHADQEMHYACG